MSTLDNLRKSARRWLKALRSADPDARARLARVYPDAPEPPTLRAVQQALARERGHESWIALTRAAQAEVASDSALTSLLDSAGKGDAARVAAILDLHPDLVNQRGLLDGHTGLRTALHFGIAHELVVRTLLQRGADPNVRDEGDHAYPLHFAAERGDLTIVTLLIEHGADPVGAVTTHELDVLGWAVCFDSAPHLDVARYLLAHGATHTLLSATAMGVVEAIRALAAAGADLNQRMDRTNHRRTPLHLAVIKKQPTALSALLALGADTRLEDAAGLTAFDHAAINADDEMTRLLIDAGAPMTLLAAIALDRADDIERLVREHPDALSMTSRERWGQMLVQASRRAPGHVIDLLLRTLTRYRAGLSVVNVADDEETAVDGASGYTPLHAAAFHGNDSAVDVLLAHGANPRRRDGKYCGTPAGWAAHAGHARTAARILEADVDIFDAIDFDRADRVMDILARDPGAGERPFKAYASCGSREGQWWPPPDCTPLEWATSREKQNALDVLTARASQWTPDNLSRAERITSFLQSACWDHQVHGRLSHRMHDMAAQRLLAADPSIADDSIYTAVVCGRRDRVAEIVATRPDAARLRGGPREWTPILYLAYTRFTHADVHAHAVEIARLLLDHGADPHDFYMAMDARYSVLTGVAGEGEQDAPRQPYAAALFDLLLERDAEAFDIQVLYNTHFSGDMQWWLDLVYTRTIDTSRGAAWRDPEWMMFDMGAYGSGARFILETAIKKGHPSLVAWALERGANPNAAPARDQRFAQRSLYELALTEGHRDIAELIARYGGARTTPRLDDREQFMQACERLDRDGAARLARAHPEYLRTHDFLFDAARRDRADTLALLIELGTSGDVEDTTGKRALHEAAFHDARQAAAWLIGRGAEIDPRERTYGGTPISWAAHGDKTAMVHLLATHSRDVRTLCAMGCVDRVRQLVAEEPALAGAISPDGRTLLWTMPDDETQALALVELLLAAGADPAVRDSGGDTAAAVLRRRGLDTVATQIAAS